MNRWDEIQGLARDIASNVHADPAKRDAMADDLIKLCGVMIAAVGKGVSITGESALGNEDDDTAGALYVTGERVQDAAREAVESATNPKVDLDRWTHPSPSDPCVCGHVPSVHAHGMCAGEHYNYEQCHGGPCTGFVRREPSGGWRHVDRRPAVLRNATGPVTVVLPDDATPEDNHRCIDCNRVERFGHYPGCSRREGATSVAPAAVIHIETSNHSDHSHNWVTALDEMGRVAWDGSGRMWQHCGVCGALPSRPCCYVTICVTCRNDGPVGGCCRPLGDVCELHG